MLPTWLNPPAMPPWEGLHPLIVHFPIALLLVAPLFVLLGLLPDVGRGFARAALVLMALGTVAAFVAVASGEAAAKLVTRTAAVEEALEEHEEMAETVRTLFSVLTVIYGAMFWLPVLRKKLGVVKRELPAAAAITTNVAYLIAYMLCVLYLANTAHLGGRLVHEFGVQAWFGGS